MTKDQLIQIVTQNTVHIENFTKLLNHHLHAHTRMRFWIITFLVTTNLALLGMIVTLMVKM